MITYNSIRNLDIIFGGKCVKKHPYLYFYLDKYITELLKYMENSETT